MGVFRTSRRYDEHILVVVKIDVYRMVSVRRVLRERVRRVHRVHIKSIE